MCCIFFLKLVGIQSPLTSGATHKANSGPLWTLQFRPILLLRTSSYFNAALLHASSNYNGQDMQDGLDLTSTLKLTRCIKDERDADNPNKTSN